MFSGALRIFLYTFQIASSEDMSLSFRQYAANTCLDQRPYNAMIILSINLLINLLPAKVYSYLFMSEAETSRKGLLQE